MITITDKANAQLVELMEGMGESVKGLRITAKARSPLKIDYALAFVSNVDDYPDDTKVSPGSFDIFIEPNSVNYVKGVTIDYVDHFGQGAFKFENAAYLNKKLEGPIESKVKQILDEMINPGVASHGGFVTLMDVKDNVVYVELGGGCQGCGMADVTLKQGIETIIKSKVPEVTAVYDVTDHAEGKNPYYQASAK